MQDSAVISTHLMVLYRSDWWHCEWHNACVFSIVVCSCLVFNCCFALANASHTPVLLESHAGLIPANIHVRGYTSVASLNLLLTGTALCKLGCNQALGLCGQAFGPVSGLLDRHHGRIQIYEVRWSCNMPYTADQLHSYCIVFCLQIRRHI